jgi:mannose/fructose/N-acetylgalactosamine-specific phosphotransferase system component IID
MTIDLNSTLNGIFPNMISLLLGLGTFYLMTEKKMKIGYLFLVFIALQLLDISLRFLQFK